MKIIKRNFKFIDLTLKYFIFLVNNSVAQFFCIFFVFFVFFIFFVGYSRKYVVC